MCGALSILLLPLLPPLTAIVSPPRFLCPSLSHTDQVVCSVSVFWWFQWRATKTTEHLGIHLSPESSYPIISPSQEGTDTVARAEDFASSPSDDAASSSSESTPFDHCTATFLFSFPYWDLYLFSYFLRFVCV